MCFVRMCHKLGLDQYFDEYPEVSQWYDLLLAISFLPKVCEFPICSTITIGADPFVRSA